MSPKITIIMPVYNVKLYLKQALDSVINQTLDDLEIICIDDCSTDGSIDILREYAQKDSRIKLVELKENQGQGNARNLAISMAKGKFVMFLDPDDWYELNACELAYKQILKNENDFVMFGFKQYYEDTKQSEVMTYWLEPFNSVLEETNIKILDLNTNFMQNAFSVCRIYNREFLNKNQIRYSDDRIDQDNIFVVNAFISTNNISILQEPIYNYRINHKSTSFKTKLWKGMINARKKSYELIKEKNVDSKYMDVFLTYCISALTHWYKKFTKLDKNIEKDLYMAIREFFIQIENEQNLKNIDSNLVHKLKFIVAHDFKSYKTTQKLKKVVQSIFSIKNKFIERKKHKVLTVFGMNFFICSDKCNILEKRYFNTLNTIQHKFAKGKKIKIVFISNECQKWAYDQLYELFQNSEFFEAQVIIIPRFRGNLKVDKTALSLDQNYQFYKQRGINVEYAYKNNKIINLKKFKPDIVFYQQKWGLPSQYRPKKVAKYALTCFSSYGYEIENLKVNYSDDFHKQLFKYFVEHEENVKRYKSYNKENEWNCCVVGYPKLDAYLENTNINYSMYWKHPNKIKVIYAPHYSVVADDDYNLGTFLENSNFILNMAKNTPTTTWCFKPHPRLKFELINRQIMSKERIEKYYKEWENIGSVYQQGSYIDLFKSSDLMITDSSSFLAEYLPSTKPLIHMVKQARTNLNSLGEIITSEYYVSHNNDELLQAFENIVIKQNDYKKSKREKIISEIIDFNESSSHKIYTCLLELIKG